MQDEMLKCLASYLQRMIIRMVVLEEIKSQTSSQDFKIEND
jgi:hypothetical protein